MKSEKTEILFAAAEASPFAKVGGLADVAGSLPHALRKLGADARLAIPLYRPIWKQGHNISTILENMYIRVANGYFKFALRATEVDGVPVYLVDIPHFFNRDDVYMYYDDMERFSAFCCAVVDSLRALDWNPDIIHCNDWHTALIPALMRSVHAGHPIFDEMAAVFSIHNLAYQGVAPAHYMKVTGLPPSEFNLHSVEFFGKVNILKAGVRHADRITTVSPRYAKEILTPEYGHGLDMMLNVHADKLSGILNGIDTEKFNPETDPGIVKNYSANSPGGKAANKEALLREMGLPCGKKDLSAPLFGMVGRFAAQKGFDILSTAIEAIMKLDIRLVILGEGDSRYEAMMRAAAEKYPAKIALRAAFDAPLAQRIYAGSDMFLMPSSFEPCGLGQMIAMRYGSIPVVRATGGLADTVKQFDPKTGKGNGFLFKKHAAKQLANCVESAAAAFKDKKSWNKLVSSAMKQDFSWDASAKKYLALYRSAAASRASNI